MKKILLSILLVAVGLSVFSQPATRILNMRPAYPLAVGETTVDSLIYAHNGLILQDIVQDSLPIYEIGHIFAQTVRYTEEGHGFYIKADSLHSSHVTYSYQTDTLPRGPIEFNSTTGRFIYYPSASDYKTFVVRFMAVSGNDTIWEDVEFDLMAQVVPEQYAFQSQGIMPDGEDYTLIASTDSSKYFNNETRTVYSYSISGKDIVFDNNVQNKVWGLSGREDIYELNIFAENLYIRSALKFPQTNVTIYAKEIYFEDGYNEIASINVSPTSIATMTNGQGLDGADAGNITLYVKTFHGNHAKRFILNGAKGQSTNLSDTTGHNNNNGTPGNGGNGGTVISNIDIQDYCDFARGSGGLKFNVVANGPVDAGTIIGAGAMGQPGHFEFQNMPFAYLHPYYITAVIRYANDAYINNYMDHVSQLCSEYHGEIEAYMNSSIWNSCSVEESTELQDAQMELEQLLFNLEQGLDYFGNSVGWVPLLSFEVMLANFDAEIDRAIPTLYMYYWLSRVDQTLQNMVIYSHQMAIQKEQDLQEKQNDINSWLVQIPTLQNEFQIVQDMIDSLTYQQNRLEERLLAKARHNVKKRNRIKKAVGICTNLINCIPVYGQSISTLTNIASNIAFATNEAGINDYGFFSNFNPVDYTAMINQLDAALDSWSWDSVGTDANYFKNQYESMKGAVSPLVSNIQNISNQLSKSSTPANEVEAEFERLKASSREWQSLEQDLIICNVKKNGVYNNITKLLGNIRTTISEISSGVITLDALRRDAFTGNSKRDLNAMQYIEKMEQRAKNRLLKYHYYLRKAYEYRLLKPYQGEFNLVGMFERFETLGMAMDSVVDANAYAALKSVFREVISDMAEEIIDEYSNNMPEQTAPITIVVPREQLDILNANENFTLNFYEMGVFSPDEENVRIVDLGIQHLETHVVGNVGYSGYMDLNLTHQGTSRFRKDGQIYWFDHMSRATTSPHTWGVRYDAISNASTNIQPSFASSSLLYSILDNNSSTNIMLFSRPSAWGDIYISKKVHTSGGADIVIDSLVLILQYDFTRRPANIRNIDITTNEGLLPYIACSEADRNGRSNGNGNLNRSYTASNQTVTFTAIEKYGTWHFVNWTNRAGAVVSDTMALTATKSTDQFYRANYERRVPILSVPDTIQVPYGSGIQTVNVANIGSGDLEMDWLVSDSLSSWVHLNSTAEGIDNGVFSFMYDANMNETYRIDSLEIFAPETDIMSKMIYIVQSGSTISCSDITLPYTEDFESYTTSTAGATGVEPDCWELVYEDAAMPDDRRPQLYYNSGFAHSGKYSLKLYNRGIYAMSELSSEIPMNHVKLEMYLRQANTRYQLEVGVWDGQMFIPVATFDNPTTDVEFVTCDFSAYYGNGRRIAFRNTVNDGSSIAYSTNYLDDITLTSRCESITLPYTEDFDSYTTSTTATTGVEPDCWELVREDAPMTNANRPQLYYKSDFAHSGNYSLKLYNRGIYAMPKLSLDEESSINQVKLEMYLRQANARYQLQVGIWEDDGTFVPVATFNNATMDVEFVTCDFSSYNGNGRRIAFRNTLGSGSNLNYSTNYLDDITLTIMVPCSISLPYTETFETYTTETTAATGIEPDCWELVREDASMTDANRPQLYYKSDFAHSGGYSLRLYNRGIYAMPELNLDDEISISQVKLEMYLRQANARYQLQVGIWEDDGTFVPVVTFNNATTDVEFVTCDFSSYNGNGRRIAFRNTLGSGSNLNYSTNYLDDITLTIMVPCSISLPYTETFETYTTETTAATGIEPDCWELVREDASMTDANRPQLYYKSDFAHSGKYSLKLYNRGIYAMPELELDDETSISQVKLEMYLRQANAKYQLQVGIWEDDSTFVPVATFNNSTTDVEFVTCDFSGYNGNGNRIAFRNVLGSGSYAYSVNYLDDITLTIVQDCSITLPYSETFESYTNSTTAATGVQPDCWEVVRVDAPSMPDDKLPQIYYKSDFAHSGDYSLKLSNRSVYAMPELAADIPMNQISLEMYLRQPNAAYRLEVGVWDDASSTFERVKLFNNSTTNVEHVTCDFSSYTGNGRRIAFRNTLGSGSYAYSYNYLDDINLTLVTNKSAEVVNTNTTDVGMMAADRETVDIAIYPNPTRDYINVECTMNDEQLEVKGIEVIDVYGKVVHTVVGANNDSPTQINVSNLAAGMYFVRVTTDEGAVTKAFVVR